MQFDTNRALYIQIAEHLRRDIVEGRLAAGTQIEPVRQMAVRLGVTPNTLQRAFLILEREGLIYTDRTSGRFVSMDAALLNRIKETAEEELIADFVASVRKMGLSDKAILEAVRAALNKEVGDNG